MSFGLTDVGLLRQNNEDVWVVCPDLLLYALADGMGGHQAGEVAARTAIETLCHCFRELKERWDGEEHSLLEACEEMTKAFQQVNNSVYLKGRSDRELKGMGTTLCCLYFHRSAIVYGNVGDSRIYRLRDNKMAQLTQDHSLLRELIERGQINEEQVEEFQYKNIITRAIGTEPYVDPTIHFSDLHPQDRFLLCSDGLSDLVKDEEISILLAQYSELEACGQALIALAKERGGHDNITVVLVDAIEA